MSLQRPRPFGTIAPRGQDARDLLFYDAAINHPEFGVTPASILAAFRAAEAGDPTQQNDLFDGLIEGDCHLRSLFEKREQAVAGKPRVIQAGDDTADGQFGAEVMRVAMSRLPLVEVFEHLLKYNRHGYSGCEIDWGIFRLGGRDWIVPTWFTPVPVRRFRINAGTLGLMNGGGLDELRLITDYRRPLGDELRTGKWLLLRRSGTALARSGLMRTGVWPAMGKRYGFRDWLVWMEKYGQPTPLAKYDEDADDTSKDVAAEIIRSIGETNGAIAPKSIEVEFAEAKRFGDSGSVHQSEIDHCNAEMSKLVNGSTLTNDNKGSAARAIRSARCTTACAGKRSSTTPSGSRRRSSAMCRPHWSPTTTCAAHRRSSRSRWRASTRTSWAARSRRSRWPRSSGSASRAAPATTCLRGGSGPGPKKR
ncbi:MAG: DUF935 family protein [Deltaproteobacteria bacterium]|nr:MAG: DUF935 family protein [Deltaproteobacteria bacterium]